MYKYAYLVPISIYYNLCMRPQMPLNSLSDRIQPYRKRVTSSFVNDICCITWYTDYGGNFPVTEMTSKGHRRSAVMTRFDGLYMTSCR